MFACHTFSLVGIEQCQKKQATLAVEATVLEMLVYKGKERTGTNQQHVRGYYQISGALYTPLESARKPPDNLVCLP